MTRILNSVKSHFIVFLIITHFALLKYNKKVSVIKINRFVPDMKHILLWTKIHNLEGEGQNYFTTHKCDYINCYFTMNRSLLGDVRYFDAVLFNLQDVSEDRTLVPSLRSWNQKYVFVANDSSDNFPICNALYDDFFNWTWTYRFV